jgi:hypothetical protein
MIVLNRRFDFGLDLSSQYVFNSISDNLLDKEFSIFVKGRLDNCLDGICSSYLGRRDQTPSKAIR